jgi:hypothetical protein
MEELTDVVAVTGEMAMLPVTVRWMPVLSWGGVWCR